MEKKIHNHPGIPASTAIQRASMTGSGLQDEGTSNSKETAVLKNKFLVRATQFTKQVQSRKNSLQEGSSTFETRRSSVAPRRDSFAVGITPETMKLKITKDERTHIKSILKDDSNTNRARLVSMEVKLEANMLDPSVQDLERKRKKSSKKHVRATTSFSGFNNLSSPREFKPLEKDQRPYNIKAYEESLFAKGSESGLSPTRRKNSPIGSIPKDFITSPKSLKKAYGLAVSSRREKPCDISTPSISIIQPLDKIKISPASPNKQWITQPLALEKIATPKEDELRIKRGQWKAEGRKKMLSWNPSLLGSLVAPSVENSPRQDINTSSLLKKNALKAIESPTMNMSTHREFLMRTYAAKSIKVVI